MKTLKKDLLILAAILAAFGLGYWFIELQREATRNAAGTPSGAAAPSAEAGAAMPQGDTMERMEAAKEQVRLQMAEEKKQGLMEKWIEEKEKDFRVERAADFGAADGIVARVDGAAIPRSELETRIKLKRFFRAHETGKNPMVALEDLPPEEKDSLVRSAAGDLVEKAVIERTEEGKAALSEEEALQTMTDNLVNRTFSLYENRDARMKELGLTDADLRTFLREIALRGLVGEKALGPVEVTEEELLERMQEMRKSMGG